MKNGCSLNTKVYKTLTDSGLLLHCHTYVAGRYKRSLVNTMLNRVLRLLSTSKFFQKECERLKETFARLCYTHNILVQSTIRPFIESKVSEDSHTRKHLRSEYLQLQSETCCHLKIKNRQTQYANNSVTSVERSM